MSPLNWIGVAIFALGCVLAIRVLLHIKHDLDQPIVRTRRDPYWFTDQAREEKRARLATFQKQAAKGLSEETKQRRHLEMVAKAGDSRKVN